jgi:hypothetical protein
LGTPISQGLRKNWLAWVRFRKNPPMEDVDPSLLRKIHGGHRFFKPAAETEDAKDSFTQEVEALRHLADQGVIHS